MITATEPTIDTFRDTLQQRQAKTQYRQDDQAGDELAAQMGHKAQAHHQSRHEHAEKSRDTGRAALSGIHQRILERPHIDRDLC